MLSSPDRGRSVTTQQIAYFFDRIEVRPARRQVLADGQVAALGSRAFDVLMTLIERRDRTVSKQELLDAVWSDSSVEEHNVVVQVGNLRRLFGAHTIATIPGRGYRFTATLEERPDGAAHDERAGAQALALALDRDRDRDRDLREAAPDLVGRDADMALLRRLLPAHRLVTIVGAAGVGKTRVAQALLAMLRPLYAHGVGWVTLGALTDGSQVPQAIARSLGMALSAADPVAGLVAALRPSNLLLVLDNAGHLVDSIAKLAESLLRGTAGVQIVVTSKVPLALQLEQVCRLEPLGLPPVLASAGEAPKHGTAAAFVRRAVLADRQLVVD
jgi:DNA-binding winged helix-turn-helix (wHTH) protein